MIAVVAVAVVADAVSKRNGFLTETTKSTRPQGRVVVSGACYDDFMAVRALIFDYSNVLHFPLQGLNRDLLLLMQSSLQPRYPLYLFTASTGWREPENLRIVQPLFRRIFTVDELGSKADPESFRRLAEQIGVPLSQIMLIDDAPENIEAIEQAGGQGIRFADNQQLIGAWREQGILDNRPGSLQ